MTNITSFQTLSQRLRPNKWRRGQSIPVAFRAGEHQIPVSVSRTVSVSGSGSGSSSSGSNGAQSSNIMYPGPVGGSQYSMSRSVTRTGSAAPVHVPAVTHSRTVTSHGSGTIPVYGPNVSYRRTVSSSGPSGGMANYYPGPISYRRTISHTG